MLSFHSPASSLFLSFDSFSLTHSLSRSHTVSLVNSLSHSHTHTLALSLARTIWRMLSSSLARSFIISLVYTRLTWAVHLEGEPWNAIGRVYKPAWLAHRHQIPSCDPIKPSDQISRNQGVSRTRFLLPGPRCFLAQPGVSGFSSWCNVSTLSFDSTVL